MTVVDWDSCKVLARKLAISLENCHSEAEFNRFAAMLYYKRTILTIILNEQ